MEGAPRRLTNCRGSHMETVGSPCVCFLKGELFQLHFLVFGGCLQKPRKGAFLLFPLHMERVRVGKCFPTISLETLRQPLIDHRT